MSAQFGLVYYMLVGENVLFAYGEHCEFFERYDEKLKTWRSSRVSYSQFLHDFNVEVVDEDRARAITGGNLPDEKYAEYRRFTGGN